MAWLYAPLAALPYPAAVMLWTALTAGLLALAVRMLWPLVAAAADGHPWRTVLVVAGSYPAAEVLGAGRNAALWLAVTAGGYRLLLAHRDAAAGTLLGLGALKPQLLVGLPVLFAAQRRWRALGAWCAVAGALAAASLGMVGVDGARAYADLLRSDTYEQGIGVGLAWKMLGLPALVRSVAPTVPAWWVAAALALPALALVWLIARRRPLPVAFGCALLLPAVANPHLFAYDGLVLLLPILLLLADGGRGMRLTCAALWFLTWTAPTRAIVFDSTPPIAAPWAAIALAVLAVFAIGWTRAMPGWGWRSLWPKGDSRA